jgi:ketosteroid isomerase-like protein
MAIRTHPSYATAHENLGDIYAKMASQAYDKALQLDRSNQAAQGKLNLIKDLFSQTSTATASRTPSKVAVAKVEPTPAPVPTPVAKPTVKPEPPAPPAAKPAPPPAAAVVPPPTAAPAKAPPPPAAPADNADEVLRFVNSWAKAWASNDIPGYLAHYSPDFQPPRGMSRSAWEAERKARIAKPRRIEVEVNSPRIKFDEKKRAVVTFRQHYKSGALDVTSNKTLVMVRNGDRWLIQQERVGS